MYNENNSLTTRCKITEPILRHRLTNGSFSPAKATSNDSFKNLNRLLLICIK